MGLVLGLAKLPLPATTAQLFGHSGRLSLEIGHGNGVFLTELAQAHPEEHFIGAELSRGATARTFRRLQRAMVTNVRLYQGCARFLVRNVLAPHSLKAVYVNYPDPWPKRRHRDRRLFRPQFLALLSARLENGGTVQLTTDYQEYFASAVTAAEASGLFDVRVTHTPQSALRTKYGQKWRALNRTAYHVVFRQRKASPTAFASELTLEPVMHHVLMNGELPAPTHFESQVHRFDGGQVILLELMRRSGTSGLVFAVRIEEAGLTQDVLIEAKPASTKHADIRVGLRSFGQPLTTKGTSEAVRAVARWLTKHGLEVRKTFW